MNEIRIIVPGPPPRKNSRAPDGSRRVPKRTARWFGELQRSIAESGWQKHARKAWRGRWVIVLDVYEEEVRHLDVDVPLGDIDSSVTAVLDGLQPKRCGVWAPLDDDARIVAMTVRKFHDKANPRVEIVLTEIADG